MRKKEYFEKLKKIMVSIADAQRLAKEIRVENLSYNYKLY